MARKVYKRDKRGRFARASRGRKAVLRTYDRVKNRRKRKS